MAPGDPLEKTGRRGEMVLAEVKIFLCHSVSGLSVFTGASDVDKEYGPAKFFRGASDVDGEYGPAIFMVVSHCYIFILVLPLLIDAQGDLIDAQGHQMQGL